MAKVWIIDARTAGDALHDDDDDDDDGGGDDGSGDGSRSRSSSASDVDDHHLDHLDSDVDGATYYHRRDRDRDRGGGRRPVGGSGRRRLSLSCRIRPASFYTEHAHMSDTIICFGARNTLGNGFMERLIHDQTRLPIRMYFNLCCSPHMYNASSLYAISMAMCVQPVASSSNNTPIAISTTMRRWESRCLKIRRRGPPHAGENSLWFVHVAAYDTLHDCKPDRSRVCTCLRYWLKTWLPALFRRGILTGRTFVFHAGGRVPAADGGGVKAAHDLTRVESAGMHSPMRVFTYHDGSVVESEPAVRVSVVPSPPPPPPPPATSNAREARRDGSTSAPVLV